MHAFYPSGPEVDSPSLTPRFVWWETSWLIDKLVSDFMAFVSVWWLFVRGDCENILTRLTGEFGGDGRLVKIISKSSCL